MATDGSPFVKIEPDRLGLSDCAAEIRNNVYKEYFRGGKLRIFPLLVGDRVTSKDEEAEYYSRGEDSIEHSHATILLCSKKVYHEALPFLYNDKVFEIVDKVVQDKVGKQIVFGTSSMPSLPQTILSNIKSLSVDITSFGYGLARLNDARTVRPAGGYITLGTWEVATSNMPKLEVLIIQCHDWLEPRNLALRFITNVRFLSSETEISFEMSVHEHKHEPGRNQTLAPWAGTDCRETDGPKTITVPAVKKLVIVGWITVEELENLEKTTFGGQCFLDLAHTVDILSSNKVRYGTGDHRFQEIRHEKVKFKGQWPRVFWEDTELDTDISRYTYSLATVPIEERLKSISLDQDATKKVAASWLRAL